MFSSLSISWTNMLWPGIFLEGVRQSSEGKSAIYMENILRDTNKELAHIRIIAIKRPQTNKLWILPKRTKLTLGNSTILQSIIQEYECFHRRISVMKMAVLIKPKRKKIKKLLPQMPNRHLRKLNKLPFM